MRFKDLFSVFSRRPHEPQPKPARPLTSAFRQRIILLCRDAFGMPNSNSMFYNAATSEFWDQIHKKLQYLHGAPVFNPQSRTTFEDVLHFIGTCSDEHFLDFIELMFRVDCFHRRIYGDAEGELVESINQFFRVDDLPYALTEIVRESRQENRHGRMQEVSVVTGLPLVIRKDNQFVFSNALKPALDFLKDPAFNVPNKEFLKALEDYRKGDFEDSLVKCGSALESVMKIICDRRGWSYKANDTAGPLLQTVMRNTSLPSFFEQPLLIVATLRNRLSSAHGGGHSPRHVPGHYAEYAINATASMILLLAEETR